MVPIALYQIADDLLAQAFPVIIRRIEKVPARFGKTFEDLPRLDQGILRAMGHTEFKGAQTELGYLEPRTTEELVSHACPLPVRI